VKGYLAYLGWKVTARWSVPEGWIFGSGTCWQTCSLRTDRLGPLDGEGRLYTKVGREGGREYMTDMQDISACEVVWISLLRMHGEDWDLGGSGLVVWDGRGRGGMDGLDGMEVFLPPLSRD